MLERLKYLRLLAWCGPVFLLVFIVFWGLMGHNIPPFQPDVPAKVIGDYFREDANIIRLGMSMAMSFTVLYFLWGLSIGKVIEYGIEKDNNILSTCAVWGAPV
jgi:hypothetical protein